MRLPKTCFFFIFVLLLGIVIPSMHKAVSVYATQAQGAGGSSFTPSGNGLYHEYYISTPPSGGGPGDDGGDPGPGTSGGTDPAPSNPSDGGGDGDSGGTDPAPSNPGDGGGDGDSGGTNPAPSNPSDGGGDGDSGGTDPAPSNPGDPGGGDPDPGFPSTLEPGGGYVDRDDDPPPSDPSTSPSGGNGDNGGNGGNGGSGGNGGGGNSSQPSGPTPAELEAQRQAQEKAENREKAGEQASTATDIGSDIDNIGQGISSEIAAAEAAATTTTEKEGDGLTKSVMPGDPVLATTGRYVLETEDYEVPGSEFSIKRKYISEGEISGSMGIGWSASIDSRINRGVTKISEAALASMEALISEMLDCYNAIDKEHASDIADEVYGKVQAARATLNEFYAIKARGEHLASLNKYSKFPGTPGSYEGVGNENLVVIDEEGTPRVYKPSGSGVWLPVNTPERLYERLESVDGGGADSTAGFVLSVKGGIKKHYNGNGMILAVSYPNGNRVELERDGEEKITKIHGPHGNQWSVKYSGDYISGITGPDGSEVQYGYSGEDLTSVKDRDGDTARYTYEEGRLKEIVKPDLSAIKITYGYSGSGGNLLVTATTHEEGESEQFDYNPAQKITTYTNHSGVVTRYRYDDKHRTVQEEHSDGRLKTFTYNSSTNLLDRETSNGFETRYRYDSRGNVTEKSYSDGTREQREWSENDQPVRYVDRDGVVTEWRYDANWNCVEVRRGGETVFSGSYDNKNRLVTSREGERAETRYEYNTRDFVSARIITINGNEIRESWESDEFGRVVKYTDGLGQVWEYSYTAKETIEKTPLGLERKYEYNNRKDLIRVVEKDTHTGEERETKYRYDQRHLLLEEEDGSGGIIGYEYRADGKPVREERGPWYFEYGYEAGGRIEEVTGGKSGSGKTYTERYQYNRQGWDEERTQIRSGAGTTSYGINAWGQVTSVTNALKERSTRTLNGAGNAIREQGASGGFYEYRYDASGRISSAGREGAQTVQARYNRDGSIAEKRDRLGNVTRYVYDGRGLLSREITALGEERYSYDNTGRMVRQETVSRNSGGYRTEWEYHDEGRTVTVTSGGMYTETLYLNAWGEVVRRVDGEGNERGYEYDGEGKLIEERDGYGRVRRYEWNEIEKVSRITYADGAVETYEYDHLGNVSEIRDSVGISWTGEYDEAGRLSKETGRPGINKEYRYDSLGRLVEVKNGGEVTERYRYTERGREVVFIDGEGNDFTQRKNAFGELTDERNRVGDNQSFGYDEEGKLSTRTGYSGSQTKIEYRESEGITITTYSDGTRSVLERDKRGNLIRASNESGTIRYRYDAGGKLIEQTDEGAGEVTRYAYNKAGYRTRMQSGNRDVLYRYGKNGELLRVFDNSQRLEVTYEYDTLNRETRRVYGNGITQDTLYDRIGRVVLIRETDSFNRLLRAEGYVYDGQGRRSHSVDEEGKVTKYEYDRQSRLSTVLYPWTEEKAESDRKEAEESGLYFTPEKGTGERYSFSATETGLLREVLNKAGPARGNAVAGNQMVWRESYTYDLNGNRASKTTPWGTIRYEYDEENRLLRKGDVIYTHDRDGNVLSEKGLRYEAEYGYNGQNRMIRSEVVSHVEKTHVVSEYAYDALGRRTLTRNVTGETLRTLYDGKGFEVIREGQTFMDGSLTTRYASGEAALNGAAQMPSNQATGERYRWVSDGDSTRTRSVEGYTVESGRYTGRGVTLYGNGEAVAVSYSSSGSSRSMYLGKDLMGSVRSVTVDTGSLEDRYEYDAFGTPYKGDLTGGMNLGYTGKPYDSATGLYNYGYRDYKPEAARFTTIDPIRDGNNWFAYVNNDPVNWVDLWGLFPDNGSAKDIFQWPTDTGRITTVSGPTQPVTKGGLTSNPNHQGIDIGPTIRGEEGQDINSIAAGIVTTITKDDPREGNSVTIKHPGGIESKSSHLKTITEGLEEGTIVEKGTTIGTMGNTGLSDFPHLDFQIHDDKGNNINPLTVLPPRSESITIERMYVEEDPKTGALRNVIKKES